MTLSNILLICILVLNIVIFIYLDRVFGLLRHLSQVMDHKENLSMLRHTVIKEKLNKNIHFSQKDILEYTEDEKRAEASLTIWADHRSHYPLSPLYGFMDYGFRQELLSMEADERELRLLKAEEEFSETVDMLLSNKKQAQDDEATMMGVRLSHDLDIKFVRDIWYHQWSMFLDSLEKNND